MIQAMSISHHSHYRGQDHTFEGIVKYLEGEGFTLRETNDMPYLLEPVGSNSPPLGIEIAGTDVAFQKPIAHPQDGLIGEFHCRHKQYARHGFPESKRLFDRLKRRFAWNRPW